MRRWLIRWLKTQWTAVPLAVFIVTGFELWRFGDKTTHDDGRDHPEAVGPLPANGHKLPNDPPARPPAADQLAPTKINQQPVDVVRKPSQKNVVATGAASAGNETRSSRPWRLSDISVNTSRPVVNPHPFNYIINCPDLCRGVDVFVLNYVHTAVDHFARRARIRRTWALQSHYRNFTIRTVFFVGISNKVSWFQDALLYESRKYGDIVQKDFLDTYKSV